MVRLASLALTLIVPAGFAAANDITDITPKQFRRVALSLLENPTAKDAADLSKIVIAYTVGTGDAAVIVGGKEFRWTDSGDDSRTLVLLAAYAAGNVQGQLSSGVKRNDRYSGLVSLFGAYHKVQEMQEWDAKLDMKFNMELLNAKPKVKFKIAAIDDLLKLHADDKLTAHLAELEKKAPAKLTPEQEKRLAEMVKPEKP